MIKIQLYWNNICILHRQELVFLDRIRSDLRQKGIVRPDRALCKAV